jgi:hypothetical protein
MNLNRTMIAQIPSYHADLWQCVGGDSEPLCAEVEKESKEIYMIAGSRYVAAFRDHKTPLV